jgi:hypothetical protein
MPSRRQLVRCYYLGSRQRRTNTRRYACGAGTSKFVGCCTSDPCSNGCVQGNIRQGGFKVEAHGQFPDASCGASSDFYTCTAGTTFWGCCKSNPCSNTPAATCKEGDLVPAFLERPEQFNAYAPSSSPSPSSTADSGSSNGAVIGGAIGGGLGGAIIIGVLIFFFCRRRKRNQQAAHPEVGATASTPMMKEGFEDRHSAQYGQSRKLIRDIFYRHHDTNIHSSTTNILITKPQFLPEYVRRQRSCLPTQLPGVRPRRQRSSGITSRDNITHHEQVFRTTCRSIIQ